MVRKVLVLTLVVLGALASVILGRTGVMAFQSPPEGSASTTTPLASLASSTLILTPTQDSWINEQSPGVNYGRDTNLSVAQVLFLRNTYAHRALLQFNLSALPPGAAVQSAALRVFQHGASGASAFAVTADAIIGPWLQDRVTWANQPRSAYQGDPAAVLDTVNGLASLYFVAPKAWYAR